MIDWLIDWVVVLRPTWHKIGHFGDIPKPNSWLGMEKLNLTQQNHTFTNQKVEMYYNTKKLKPGLVVSYDIQPGNRDGLFWFRHFVNLSLYFLRFTLTHTGPSHLWQELIRRWDSECELFYDIVHVEASTYTHWTDFLISTTNIYARLNLCT